MHETLLPGPDNRAARAYVEPADRPRPDFKPPYYEVLKHDARAEMPDYARNEPALTVALNEICDQALQSFDVYESKAFPGVKFSFIHIAPTEDLVRRIGETFTDSATPAEDRPAEASVQIEGSDEAKGREAVFFFPSLGSGEADNAMNCFDGSLHIAMLKIREIANAMRRGEPVPQVDIYSVGAPHGLGGEVTQEWLETLKREGFEAFGKHLFSEFVEAHLPKDENGRVEETTQVELRGASRGVANAAYVFEQLPPEIKEKTKFRGDNPAGVHMSKGIGEKITAVAKGLQTVIGFGAEGAVRYLANDPTLKIGMAQGKSFDARLAEYTGLAGNNEDPAQAKLKKAEGNLEMWQIAAGTNAQEVIEKNRFYFSSAKADPLNESPVHVIKTAITHEKSPVKVQDRGRSIDIMHEGFHYFSPFIRWNSWTKTFDTCRRAVQPKPQQAV